MRRTDKEVIGIDNILAILDKCEIMRIGLSVADRPYIVPMNFACERISEKVFLYFHCASQGRKLKMIAKNNNVCFEADCSYKTLKADSACHWSAEFQSVIGEGTIEIVTNEEQKIRTLDLLMERYGFEGSPHYAPQALAMATVLRLSVEAITGKSKIVT